MALDVTYSNVLKDLEESQLYDHDNREKARESDHFVNKKDGQWEPSIATKFSNQPRYTLDKTSGVVADLSGEMNSMDFTIKIRPAGGSATNELANHIDGLIRNIENNSGSGARYIYKAAGKTMITTGIAGWGIEAGYRDPLSMDQDLIIKPISNFMDRVWFDPGAEERSAADADWGFKLTSMSMADYERDFPKGSKLSIGRDIESNVYSFKKERAVVVAEHYWKKFEKAEIVLMSDNSVFLVDDKFKMVVDELAEQGIQEVRRRETKAVRVFHRILDGGDFLTPSRETVFEYVPLVPCYANFEISEDKIIYWGVVEKLMDPQRILNYAESRKIGEGALSPRAKKWMTAEQAAGYETEIATLNTNADPVQFYNHVPDQPPPFETGGAQINAGLQETTQAMDLHIQGIANKLDPTQNNAFGLQSGVALERVENKANNGNYEYFIALEVAIAHTATILKTGALARVYDARREVQLDSQDGTIKTITLNERIFDQETQQVVELNDLSKGYYSVVCSAGPAFNNRQEEGNAAFERAAQLDPTLMQLGADIWLRNMSAPGMDVIADRKRIQMVVAGVIPENELTEEEKQLSAQVAEQNKQPSAVDQALIAEAQARTKETEAKAADTMSKIEERQNKHQIAMERLMLDGQKAAQAQQDKQNEVMIDLVKSQDNQIKILAETLVDLRNALGADEIVSGETALAYKQTARKLSETIATSE
jgi:hypothetical protein